jgi:hypothetical protein
MLSNKDEGALCSHSSQMDDGCANAHSTFQPLKQPDIFFSLSAASEIAFNHFPINISQLLPRTDLPHILQISQQHFALQQRQ